MRTYLVTLQDVSQAERYTKAPIRLTENFSHHYIRCKPYNVDLRVVNLANSEKKCVRSVVRVK